MRALEQALLNTGYERVYMHNDYHWNANLLRQAWIPFESLFSSINLARYEQRQWFFNDASYKENIALRAQLAQERERYTAYRYAVESSDLIHDYRQDNRGFVGGAEIKRVPGKYNVTDFL